MAGVFDTSDMGGPQASPVTPKAGVTPALPASKLLLTQLGVEAGMEGYAQHVLGRQEETLEDIQEQRNEELGQLRLKALTEKFDTLSIGVSQGLPTSQANVRARAALAEAKAAVPWIGDRADQAFKAFFGGSAGGFEESSEEKVMREVNERILTTAATLNVSAKEAQLVVQTEAQNDAAEQLLRQKKLSQQNNEGSFRDFNNSNIVSSTIQTQAILKGHLQPGETTLRPEAIASVNASISTMASQMRMKLRNNAFKEDGRPYLTEESLKSRYEEIDKWEKDQKALVSDRSYLTVMTAIRDTGNAELAVSANDLFPIYRIMDEAGGQVAVQDFIKGLQDPRYIPTLVARNPKLAAVFTEEGDVRQLTAGGLAKAYGHGQISDPESNIKWAAGAMTRGGAQASQAFLAEPTNAPSAQAAYDQVLSEDSSVAKNASEYHRDSGRLTPSETARTLTKKVFKDYYKGKPDEGFKILSLSLEGMAWNFRQALFEAGMPVTEEISLGELRTKPGTDEVILSLSMTNLPDTAKEAIGYQLRTLQENPEYVQRFEEIMGIPLTPVEVVEVMVNDRLPQKFLDRAIAQKEAGSFKGYPLRKEDAYLSGLSFLGKIQHAYSNRLSAKQVEEKMKKGTVAPLETDLEDLFATEEPKMPELTKEQVKEIKDLPTLEEKKAKALEYGIPKELIEKVTRGR